MLLAVKTFALRNSVAASGGAPPPVYVASGTVISGESSGNVPYYSGVAANHIALLWVLGYRTGASISDISGWTGLTVITRSGSAARLFWKRLAGSESGSVTYSITGSGAALSTAVMAGFSGAIISGTPYEGAGSANGGSTSQTAATIVTLGGNRLGVRCGSFSGYEDTTPPASWTERVDSIDFGMQIDTIDIPAATTVAASTRTFSVSADWFVQTLALLPNA